MLLDERGLKILKTLASNPTIYGSQLENELSLSRKQLSYALEKINVYLLENDYDEIKRLKTGKFVVPNSVVEAFCKDKQNYDKDNYVFTEQERIYFITLVALLRNEALSINHFSYILKVSKNTILMDMKKVQTSLLDHYDLKLIYDRHDGYRLLGKEYDKRQLMIKIIYSITALNAGEFLLSTILEIDDAKVESLREDVYEVEKALNVNYTDDRIRVMPYILYFTFRRINSGKHLESLPEEYHHIFGTSEYSKIVTIFQKYNDLDDLDKIYIVSQFQVSSISSSSINENQIQLNLYKTAKVVLEKFEKLSCIKLNDHEALLNALVMHLKPTIYRINFDYHMDSSILDLILPQHSYLFEITKLSITPFEDLIGKSFPDEELAYITILFGGWMSKDGTLNSLKEKPVAIVVCTNGVSISNFLLIKLKQNLPEIKFNEALSVRQFNTYNKKIDLVFSTVPLETDAKLFVVKPIMNEFDIQNLRRKVFTKLQKQDICEVNSSYLVNIIEQYCVIENRNGLTQALRSALGEEIEDNKLIISKRNKNELDISDVLTEDCVIVTNELLSWEDAIKIASKPLLVRNCIEQRYITKIIRSIKESSLWTIADGLMIAHAGVDDGVNDLGVSILKLKDKIKFNDQMEASIIIVLATPDKTKHLKILYRLIDITEKEDEFAALQAAQSKYEILKIINKKG